MHCSTNQATVMCSLFFTEKALWLRLLPSFSPFMLPIYLVLDTPRLVIPGIDVIRCLVPAEPQGSKPELFFLGLF